MPSLVCPYVVVIALVASAPASSWELKRNACAMGRSSSTSDLSVYVRREGCDERDPPIATTTLQKSLPSKLTRFIRPGAVAYQKKAIAKAIETVFAGVMSALDRKVGDLCNAVESLEASVRSLEADRSRDTKLPSGLVTPSDGASIAAAASSASEASVRIQDGRAGSAATTPTAVAGDPMAPKPKTKSALVFAMLLAMVILIFVMVWFVIVFKRLDRRYALSRAPKPEIVIR